MKVFSYTGKGLRKTNEEYIKSEILSDGISLHIIADGMGGYKFGEVASKTYKYNSSEKTSSYSFQKVITL